MLHQELPRIDATRLDGWGRWLTPALIGGAALTIGLFLQLLGRPPLALVAILVGAAGAAWSCVKAPRGIAPSEPLIVGPDFSLVGSTLGLSRDPTALTSSEGSVLVVNSAYRDRFGGNLPPLSLGANEEAQ